MRGSRGGYNNFGGDFNGERDFGRDGGPRDHTAGGRGGRPAPYYNDRQGDEYPADGQRSMRGGRDYHQDMQGERRGGFYGGPPRHGGYGDRPPREDRRDHRGEDERGISPKILEGQHMRRIRGRGDMRMRGGGRGGPPMGRGDFGREATNFRGGMNDGPQM